MCIGGPALIYYVTPTEEELFMVSLGLILYRPGNVWYEGSQVTVLWTEIQSRTPAPITRAEKGETRRF